MQLKIATLSLLGAAGMAAASCSLPSSWPEDWQLTIYPYEQCGYNSSVQTWNGDDGTVGTCSGCHNFNSAMNDNMYSFVFASYWGQTAGVNFYKNADCDDWVSWYQGTSIDSSTGGGNREVSSFKVCYYQVTD
ncbi:hypothetical protein HYDPIDRAFT_164939 [Hydnomerulius pinastri MD-312]|nr:hypothetical protein HYDPIDRAFT_164939 [Hydnomerulius pinastri MD-312]